MQTAKNRRREFVVIGIFCLVVILPAGIGCAPYLTVTKTVVPAGDSGRFNIQIDGSTKATDVGNGGRTSRMSLSEGTHTVSETAGIGTNLSDYISIIGGDCAADGSITLAGDDDKMCTITTARKPPTGEDRAACLARCEEMRDGCMSMVGGTGGPLASQCAQMYTACVRSCPAQ